MIAIACPKCDRHLSEYDLVHREAEGGAVQVSTSYLRCPGCGYTTERVERQTLPAWLVAANAAAAREMQTLIRERELR